MTYLTDCKRIKDLVRLFGSLERLQDRLLTLIQSKIDAMRRADIAAMRELGDQEREVVMRLHERDGLRCQLMEEIGRQLRLPPRAARALPVSQLAARLPKSEQGPLLGAAGSLAAAATKVAQVNRVAGAVSRDLLHHLNWVFASVRPRDAAPIGYAGNGALVSPGNQRIFETIG